MLVVVVQKMWRWSCCRDSEALIDLESMEEAGNDESRGVVVVGRFIDGCSNDPG